MIGPATPFECVHQQIGVRVDETLTDFPKANRTNVEKPSLELVINHFLAEYCRETINFVWPGMQFESVLRLYAAKTITATVELRPAGCNAPNWSSVSCYIVSILRPLIVITHAGCIAAGAMGRTFSRVYLSVCLSVCLSAL